MSQRTTCDGCGKPAPKGYLHRYASVTGDRQWISVDSLDVDVDVCSWACLATVVAAEIALDIEDARQ